MLNPKYSSIISETVVGSNQDNLNEFVKTGYKNLDIKLNGGLRHGCCYLFTGLEKSGKSSFIFNILNDRISNDKKTGILSTEMECDAVIKRMMSIAGLDPLSASFEEINYYRKQLNNNLLFFGKDELTNITTANSRRYDFAKFLKAIDEIEKDGADLVIVDNLTTLGAEAGDYKVLGNYTNQLITHVKDKEMAVIFVIHVKQDTTFRETPDGIRNMIKTGKVKDIFKESITVVARPTLKDVYGGGQALSQISGGTIMLWRPFQKFDFPGYQRMGLIIIDSHRFGASADIQVEYDGQTGKFWEVEEVEKS